MNNLKSLILSIKTFKNTNPQMRLGRQNNLSGAQLVMIPGLMGISAFHPYAFDPHLQAVFVCGSILTRATACTINDLWDVEFDRRVERCKNRPLASGEVKQWQGVLFAGAQMGLCFPILFMLNKEAILAGFATIIPVILQPSAKRYYKNPQFILGLTINMPMIVAYFALGNGMENIIPCLIMYSGNVIWTIQYDTIQGLQDADDDRKLGLRSNAIEIQKRGEVWNQLGQYALLNNLLWMISLSLLDLNCYSVIMTGIQQSQQVYNVHKVYNGGDKKELFQIFRNNYKIGVLFILGLIQSKNQSESRKISKSNIEKS